LKNFETAETFGGNVHDSPSRPVSPRTGEAPLFTTSVFDSLTNLCWLPNSIPIHSEAPKYRRMIAMMWAIWKSRK
jgi:hypothetical protein